MDGVEHLFIRETSNLKLREKIDELKANITVLLESIFKAVHMEEVTRFSFLFCFHFVTTLLLFFFAAFQEIRTEISIE
jgi:hypothetical protein